MGFSRSSEAYLMNSNGYPIGYLASFGIPMDTGRLSESLFDMPRESRFVTIRRVLDREPRRIDARPRGWRRRRAGDFGSQGRRAESAKDASTGLYCGIRFRPGRGI